VPEPVLAVLGGEREDVLAGLVHAVSACARMLTMAERSDLLGTSFRHVEDGTGRTATGLVCYDCHPGGLGYACKAYEHLEHVLDNALGLVDRCRCPSGCPACVGAYGRDRSLVTWALRRLFEETPPPAGARLPRLPPMPTAGPPPERVPWREVTDRWGEVVARLRAANIVGADLLTSLGAGAVERQGSRLVVRLASPGLAEWLEADAVQRQLWAGLERAVALPPEGGLTIEVTAQRRESALGTAIKLQRRHDDLVAERPHSEREADQKLAGGYLLPEAPVPVRPTEP
jgi:DEAD/DEAH box helicase domain-containing protein